MARGMLDLFSSRRNYFDRCDYWNKNDDDSSYSNLDYEYIYPDGTFYAKQINSMEQLPQVIMGAFMFDSETVTITSNDELSGLKQNDIVRFRGEIYRVENIQSVLIKNINQYYDEVPRAYYMRLKR